MKPNKDMTFFIYGSGRKHMHNHWFLEDANFKGYAVVHGYSLYSLGSYPAIVKSNDENDIVVGELYQFVDEQIMNHFNNMEIGAGYELIESQAYDEDGKMINVVLYVFKHGDYLDENKIVKSGDWVMYKKNNQEMIKNEIQSKKGRKFR